MFLHISYLSSVAGVAAAKARILAFGSSVSEFLICLSFDLQSRFAVSQPTRADRRLRNYWRDRIDIPGQIDSILVVMELLVRVPTDVLAVHLHVERVCNPGSFLLERA